MEEYLGFYYELSSDGRKYAIYDRTAMLNELHMVACGASATRHKWLETEVLNRIEQLYKEAKEKRNEEIFRGV